MFERKARTVINNQTFDLNRTPYHLLLSVGSEVNGKNWVGVARVFYFKVKLIFL